MKSVVERLSRWAMGEAAGPQFVQIYPTNKCNLRCLFCYQTLERYDLADVVPRERWFEAARELCGMGVEEALISGGGEPLCEKALTMGLMRILKDAGVKGRLITNGTLWSIRTIGETVEMRWDSVVFSIDGARPRTHDALRLSEGSFARAVKNVKRFREAKQVLGSDLPNVELTFVLTNTNFREAPDYVRLGAENGAGCVTVEPVCVNNPETEDLKLSQAEREEFFAEVLPTAEEEARAAGIFTNFHKLRAVKVIEKTGDLRGVIEERKPREAGGGIPEGFDRRFLSLPCYEPWVWPKIEANGEVWPCSTSPLRANIRKRSFEEIWTGPELRKFRGEMLDGKLSESCGNCVLTHLYTHGEMAAGLRAAAARR